MHAKISVNLKIIILSIINQGQKYMMCYLTYMQFQKMQFSIVSYQEYEKIDQTDGVGEVENEIWG